MRTHGVLMAAWSRTGKVLCHSSCEAELVALHEGIVESKRLKSLMMEIGIQNVQITLVTDSSASIRVAMRRGLGRLKHIELKYISLQQDLRDGIIQLKFVPGANNQKPPPSQLGLPTLQLGLLFRKYGASRCAGVLFVSPVSRCPGVTAI